MKRVTTLAITVALIGSLVLAGFAGTAAAGGGDHNDKKAGAGTSLGQDADAGVWQDQDVTQLSLSDQDASAFAAGGNATVEQNSEQFNSNSQIGDADAENSVENNGIVIAL